MRITIKQALAAALLALAGSPAAAQGPEPFFDLMESCRQDSRRFCDDVAPGGGRIARCLAANKYELSPGCYKAVTVGAAIRACTPDYYRLCPGVPVGDGRVLECLAEQQDDVSDYCQIALGDALTGHQNSPTAAYGHRRDRDDVDEDDRNDDRQGYDDRRKEDYRGKDDHRDDRYADKAPPRVEKYKDERGSYERDDDVDPDTLK